MKNKAQKLKKYTWTHEHEIEKIVLYFIQKRKRLVNMTESI